MMEAERQPLIVDHGYPLRVAGADQAQHFVDPGLRAHGTGVPAEDVGHRAQVAHLDLLGAKTGTQSGLAHHRGEQVEAGEHADEAALPVRTGSR